MTAGKLRLRGGGCCSSKGGGYRFERACARLREQPASSRLGRPPSVSSGSQPTPALPGGSSSAPIAPSAPATSSKKLIPVSDEAQTRARPTKTMGRSARGP